MATHYRNLNWFKRLFKPKCPKCKARMKGPMGAFGKKYECERCGAVLFDIDYH